MACVVFRRAFKRIELSRGVQAGQGYGDCNQRIGRGWFTRAVSAGSSDADFAVAGS
jgi:hypothetical protein